MREREKSEKYPTCPSTSVTSYLPAITDPFGGENVFESSKPVRYGSKMT